jgi:hypothetical protein
MRHILHTVMESAVGDNSIVIMESKKKKAEISKIVDLAEDEKKMDGAPETELADVTVFQYDELEVSFSIRFVT